MNKPRFWHELNIMIDPTKMRRFYYYPHRDLDFIDLPAPIHNHMYTLEGVLFYCYDRSIYYLKSEGEPMDTNHWRITCIHKD